jgi:DNA-binding beta-propeller fold protein YncE
MWRNLKLATVLVGLALAAGAIGTAFGAKRAADEREATAASGLVWPQPPAQTRIRFVKSVGGASDWGVARNWWGRVVDTVTGRHEARFVRPTGVAEQDGVLYVADPGQQVLVLLDGPRHKELRIARVGNIVLVSPVAVALGLQGTVYLADSHLRQVLQLDRDGNLLREFSSDGLQRPSSLAFDAGRQLLYVGDSKAHVVHVFDDHGAKVRSIGGLGADPGQFNSPTHVAVRADGSVAVTDALNFRVQVFDADGHFQYQLGELGDGAGNFAAPKGVAFDRAGHVYAADAMFDAIQVFDAEGRLMLGFGEQGTRPGQFWIPNGIYINGSDQLFVADAYNRRIQVFQIVSDPTAALVDGNRGPAQ